MVHTVPLCQLKRALERWPPAIDTEVQSLRSGTLERISMSEAKSMERQGQIHILPSNGTFTLKPPTTKGDVYKRKFRFVICGSFALKLDEEDDGVSLYAGKWHWWWHLRMVW